MDLLTFLGMPEHFVLVAAECEDELVTLHLQSTQPSADCPVCHQAAMRVHSHYQRTVADLPGGARRVRLHLLVQKFYCDNAACDRAIFVERITPFVAPWARMTTRLNHALRTIGLATCGRLGARLATRLGMPVSWLTIIRRLVTDLAPAPTSVTHVGIDDFAFRRRHHYGSLLVNLDAHTLIDLLPDRTVETATAWLQSHPEIVVVSRDRGDIYALAAQRALPDTQQVADRFHIVKNFTDALEPILARCWASLPPPETMIFRDAPSPPPPSPPAPALSDLSQLLPAERAVARRAAARTPEVQARFVVKQQQFAEVMTLAAEQMSPHKIAATLGVSPRTVSRWIQTGLRPGSRPRRQYPRMLDSFAGYLRRRWQQGCQDTTVLWQEVQARGFRGSQRTLYRFVEILKAEHPRPPQVPSERPSELPPLDFAFLLEYSYRDALWWFIRAPTKLSARLTRAIEALCHVSPPLRHLYTLAQSFVSMVRTRCGEQLDG